MFISRSPADTETFGRDLAERAAPGSVIALVGDLGAGKTQIVKGFVAGCNCNTAATSPTFTLLHEYGGGRLPVYHFDFYRLENAAELEQIGIDEYLAGNGVCVIEWADRFPDAIPSAATWIELRQTSESEREIIVR